MYYNDYIFPQVDEELANLVLSISDECYSELHPKWGGTLTININIDPLLRKLYREEMPELSDFEIEQLIIKYNREREEEERIEKEKKAEMEKKIKSIISNDPIQGWQWAYQLCGDLDTETTRRVRYQVQSKIQDLSILIRVDICEKYLKDCLGKETMDEHAIIGIYGDIISILLASLEEKNYDIAADYLIKALEHSKDKWACIDTIFKKVIEYEYVNILESGFIQGVITWVKESKNRLQSRIMDDADLTFLGLYSVDMLDNLIKKAIKESIVSFEREQLYDNEEAMCNIAIALGFSAMNKRKKKIRILRDIRKGVYADSSSISEDEKPYYHDDKYYKYYTVNCYDAEKNYFDSTDIHKRISFEEYKKNNHPVSHGLFEPEIELLRYCEKREYPKPRKGYPGVWWFTYGIRDVGHCLESLEQRGFIQWGTIASGLFDCTMPELKIILKSLNHSVSGKKSVLIDRIGNEIEKGVISIPKIKEILGKESIKDHQDLDLSPKYELTNLGIEVLKNYNK